MKRPSFLPVLIGTGFGSGFSPFAPGTAGALLASIIWIALYFLLPFTALLWTTAALVVLFTFAGIWAANKLESCWGEERDELNGFDIGADEYISKPFSPKILVARVNALLRRANKLGKETVISEAGGIVMDKTAHTVAIDGRNIELSVKEFELLDYFMSNQGIALTRERILDSVWSYDYFGDARTIDTHVKKLRSKMGAKGDYIKTVWGVGYKFEIQ